MKVSIELDSFKFSGDGDLGEIARQAARLLKAGADIVESEAQRQLVKDKRDRTGLNRD